MSSQLTSRSTPRLSPVHDALAQHAARWGQIDGMQVALDFGNPAREAEQARSLGLADLSALPRVVYKGPSVETFLLSHCASLPEQVYDVVEQAPGGLLARTGGKEYFVEDHFGTQLVGRLDQAWNEHPNGVYRVLRQDACLLLVGSRVNEVLSQTCSFDFRRPGQKVVMTRIAGTSCMMLWRTLGNLSGFQIWVDGTMGMYLWETLDDILRELGAGPVGLACLIPALSAATSAS